MATATSLRQRRNRRIVAWIAACCLWLQSAIAGACGVHDAGHDVAALNPIAATDDGSRASHAHAHDPGAGHEHDRTHDDGDADPGGLHAMLHAMHCACAHGAAATAPEPPAIGRVVVNHWGRYAQHLRAPITPSLLLRPPIAC